MTISLKMQRDLWGPSGAKSGLQIPVQILGTSLHLRKHQTKGKKMLKGTVLICADKFHS